MSEKKVTFSEESVKQQRGDIRNDANKSRRFKEKHSLDSDEEDAPDNYDLLKDDDIEGQEDATIDYDEGISITPFNMKEEMEEGHFDSEGMYIFKKDKDRIRDEWADNIDWVKIKEQEKKYGDVEDDDDSDSDAGGGNTVDKIAYYKQMIEIMQEGESVTKALKRLGKSNLSASQRWKKQKTQKSDQSEEDKAKAAKNNEDFLKLTGLADELLSCGELEIYQATYEKLAFTVKEDEESKEKEKTHIPEGADDDDALDMFAADIDSKQGNKSEESSHDKEAVVESSSKDSEEKSSASNEVKWEYKWDDKEDAEIHGPHTSSDMLQWQEGGFFEAGVFCRKVGTNGPFYSSKRIDFDLYT